jgi:hypothetical protein
MFIRLTNSENKNICFSFEEIKEMIETTSETGLPITIITTKEKEEKRVLEKIEVILKLGQGRH